MARLNLLVLGPPRLERDGRPVALPLRRAVALLVYLAATGRPQGRDALAALLWPESDEREGRGRLRRTLHRLTEALGDEAVVAEGDTLRLSPSADLWLDSRAFEEHAADVPNSDGGQAIVHPEQLAHATEAASLYVDDFLAGFALPDSPAWDEWQFLQREALRQTAARVLEWLAVAHEAAGAWDQAIGYTRRWLALDSVHEPAHRALMRLYALAGQHAAAMRQYQECTRLLESELGVAPEEETNTLFRTIRSRQLSAPASRSPHAVDQVSHASPDMQRPVPDSWPAAVADLESSSGGDLPPTEFREERRWVSVLVANLSGFATLAEQLDPEDLQALAHQCAEQLSQQVRRFGGTVINIMGDAVVAVFGAPVAHEDDADRAVRAGLAIRDCQLGGPVSPNEGRLEARVGIATGEVMAGPAGPEGRRDYTVMGGTVNRATRLVSSATARSVLVGEETYRATSGRVRYREARAIEDRERDRPLPAWEALDAGTVPRPRPLGTAPLVGRDQELTLLVGTWTKVKREARPHLVTIVGEPGIGKSRLIAEFERRARALGNAVFLHGRCLPYGEALGYWALAMVLREAADITPDDEGEVARKKLGDLVAAVAKLERSDGDANEMARHLALLSGLDTAADRVAPPADERTIQVTVRRFLEALARRHPLCLLIEDIHWADEALLNLLEFVAARAQGSPLLLVTQARPELLERRPTWGRGVRAFTSLSLEPLDEESGRDLAHVLCRERDLPGDVAEQVWRGAGGNPLFAEELIATIAERRDSTGVPSAIRALISARLDSLPTDERRVLQGASAFGKHFWLGGLAALGLGGNLTDQLEELEQRDLLRAQPRSRFPGDREYAFKHDLIRDVAYLTLPRSERRRLHGRIADWIEAGAGERADDLLDLLAHHAVESEQHDRALRYLNRAAQRARRASAHREEAALLGRAIGISERSGRDDLIPEFRAQRGRAFASIALWADARRELEAALDGMPPERRERRAEMLVDLTLACNWSMDCPAVKRNASAALALADAVGRADLAMGSRFWLAWASGSDGDVAGAIEQYRDTLERAGELGVSLAPNVLPLYSTALCWAGEFDQAIDCARAAVEIAREASDTDATILGLQVLGLALAGTGRYGKAMAVFDEAFHFGRDHGIGPFLARSYALSAGFHLDVFDFAGHEALASEACDLARSVDFSPSLVSASIDLLLNFARTDQVGRAERLATDVAGAVERGASWHGWLWKLRFAQARAEIALARGDPESAVALASQALNLSRGKRAKYQALARITRAQAMSARGRPKEAVADLREAVRIARPIGDPALFLRGAVALLAIDGDDQMLAEAREKATRILAALPTDEMRQRFRGAEALRPLGPPVTTGGADMRT